ncbi:MAG: hypothetical protein AB7Y74_00820 [Syntrophorhabdus sp.]
MEDEKQVPKENVGTHTILKLIFGVVSAAILLFGGYHGLNSYMDSRVEARINNPEYLQKLARSVRPSLLFDDKGSIVADMGAVSFVKSIKVSKKGEHSLKISITPFEYLGIEPLLEALDDRYMIEVKRGEMFDWIFTLHEINAITDATSASPSNRNRFRLELIR